MSELRVRPVEDSDYPAVALIGNATWPDQSVTAAELRARDGRRRVTHVVRRRVAERDSRIVGWSLAEWGIGGMQHGSVQVTGAVLPAARGTGVGAALIADLEGELRGGGAARVIAEVREHHHAARTFFEARGFRVVMRYAVSRLEMARFDAARFAPILDRVTASGVTITSARALRSASPDAVRGINALRWALLQDVPSADPPVYEPDAALATYLDEQPTALPDGWLIARLDGELIGLSTLWRSLADPTVVHTGLTGVRAPWRRRGIATALKVRAIEYARSIGARRINTDNEENNPMYGLNLSLGFEPQPAWLAYRLDLAPQGSSSA